MNALKIARIRIKTVIYLDINSYVSFNEFNFKFKLGSTQKDQRAPISDGLEFIYFEKTNHVWSFITLCTSTILPFLV